ncbi:putative RNA-dependent RNA polymerase [Raphanus sativus chrysovirus 1]|uniref:RNA-directed RNA polymerase n=1 Tax=Raphanus sativus chrysovirus 1 TaxID=1162393 RepID=H9BPR1_9VIRU|nr:putative RNA-dependent RNA polymerase [Raphanus sativus chrysovirus 1]AFE83590.1 putative RNA-dependent RNA polymerase [Raphanus sativus chrysovirus 1]
MTGRKMNVINRGSSCSQYGGGEVISATSRVSRQGGKKKQKVGGLAQLEAKRGYVGMPDVRLDIGEEVRKVMDSYEIQMKYYLAHSSSIGSYKAKMNQLVNKVGRFEVPNLWALVMPGGHGKSWLSREYGFMDVDDLVDGNEFYELCQMRYELIERGDLEWTVHNERWYSSLRATLEAMTFERPTVVLVHSEECALEMGAKIMGVIVLEEPQFEVNIMGRDSLGKSFSRISRAFVMHRSMNEINVYRSNDEVEGAVLALCNILNIPVACPYKYSYQYENSWYGRSTPRWLLEGSVVGRENETDHVLKLALQGEIPKECVDHFVQNASPNKTSHGYGITMAQWGYMMGRIVGSVRRPQKFDLTGDMFEIFPPDSMAERHRVNVTLRRLITECDILNDADVLDIMEHHVGEKHVFVSGLVCHWLGLGVETSVADKIYVLYLVPQEQWSQLLSDFHSMIRLSGWFCTTKISEEEKQSLMYMNMYTGREMYEPDWEKVVNERKVVEGSEFVSFDPRLKRWTRAQYLDDFDFCLQHAYSPMISNPRPVNVKNFLEFWKARRTWVAKGSTVMNHLPKEMLSYVIRFGDRMADVIRMRHNKKSLFENHEILDLIRETADTWNCSKVVAKLNETGKRRELLPGTLMHYIVFSYVLYVAEAQEPVGSTRLNVNDDDNLAYYDRKMGNGLHHMLYDWSNFNAQHSTDDMAKVIQYLARIPGCPEDYSTFCCAIADSFYHMWVIDPDGDKHEIKKGLFSGWRGTTWINTVLNHVYVAIGVMCCERIYRDFKPAYFDHGGDDLDVGFMAPQDCYKMMVVMDLIGYEATKIKQMIGYDAEFYRNTITARGVFASPSRGLANFVSGNWESGGAKTLREKASSILDQVWKLQRRGVEPWFCNKLTSMALGHWLKIKIEDEWFTLNEEIIHGDPAQGGLGIPDERGEIWILDKTVIVAKDKDLSAFLPGAYCSSDYVEVVDSELKGSFLHLRGKEGLINKLAQQSYDLEQFEERDLFREMNRQSVKKVGSIMVLTPRWNEVIFSEFQHWCAEGGRALRLEKIETLKEFVGHIFHNERRLTLKDLMTVFMNEEVTENAINFKANPYYRRLLPDFLASLVDKFTRWYGNRLDLTLDEMEKVYTTVAYMISVIYEHHA